jgi:hypothetical protein
MSRLGLLLALLAAPIIGDRIEQ